MKLKANENHYSKFLESKSVTAPESGIHVNPEQIHPILFDFQRDIVVWSLRKGKSAIFAGTGLGKTIMQLEWSKHVCQSTNGNVIILAPLAVAEQTVREGLKLGLTIHLCRTQLDVKPGINITNYEMLSHFNPDSFSGVVLDESGILKSFEGKVRTEIITKFQRTPYKLACTATPAPNDYMELGNHSEFLDIRSRTEMLSMFFVHDGGQTSVWRIKGHAVHLFWGWVASWAVMLSNPRDLGYNHQSFDLPPLNFHVNFVDKTGNMVFEAETLNEQRKVRRDTLGLRVKHAKVIVDNLSEPVIVWCELNDESEMLSRELIGSLEIKGSDNLDDKKRRLLSFVNNPNQKLITKPSIAGFGMNFQHCSKMIFVGLSHSFEQYYQAIRRCWRFGQTKPVDVYILLSEKETGILRNIQRKEKDFELMLKGMIAQTQEITKEEIRNQKSGKSKYEPNIDLILPRWIL